MTRLKTARAIALATSMLAAPAAASATGTSLWASNGVWRVDVDDSVGGCFASVTYTNPTTYLRFGYTTTGGYIAIANPNWHSLEPDQTYNVDVSLDGQQPTSVQAIGHQTAGANAMVFLSSVTARPVDLFNLLAASTSIRVTYQGQQLLYGPLTGSSVAVQSLDQCEQAHGWGGFAPARPSDPFRARSSDPFARKYY